VLLTAGDVAIGGWIFGANNEEIGAWQHGIGNVASERSVAAFVPCDGGPVDPYCGAIIDSAEVEENSLEMPLGGISMVRWYQTQGWKEGSPTPLMGHSSENGTRISSG
jgi:hypothetical protein